MNKTHRLARLKLFVKRCESSVKASQERVATERAARIGGNVRVAAVRRQISNFLIFELIPGTTLARTREEIWVSTALQALASIHSGPIPEGVLNHCHGESLRDRLERELEFVREWPGICADSVGVIRDAIGQPELSRVNLQEVSPVLGHGDYQACNLICASEGVIAPIDWIDSGLCDPRYEWAHLLNSLDDLFEARTGVERFGERARQILCPDADETTFNSDLRLGETINRVIVSGSVARNVVAHGENAAYRATFSKQVKALVAIL